MRRQITLFIVACLIVGAGLEVALAKDGHGRGLQRSAEDMQTRAEILFNWESIIPFNMSNANYWTGLHIISDDPGIHTFEVYFYNGDDHYALETFSVSGEGWSGTPQSILTPPKVFQSPSLLYIYSDEPFMVVQFIGKTDGLGYSSQTFYSHPSEWDWPYYYDGGMILY